MDSDKSLFRDNSWLKERIKLLIEERFSDVPQGYPITVGFGIRARYRFGTISAKGGKCFIRVNSLFADPEVPEYVVDETLAHELVHYAHGFGSGLPRLYQHPHQGGVIELEFAKRGLLEVHTRAEAWRKQNWEAFYKSRHGETANAPDARKGANSNRWGAFLNAPNCRSEAELAALFQDVQRRIGLANPLEIANVGWISASSRQKALSYYYPKSKRVELHGLLADRRVPETVLIFEFAYWIIRRNHSGKWERIQEFMVEKGLKKTMEEALAWREKTWTRFRNQRHPLNGL